MPFVYKFLFTLALLLGVSSISFAVQSVYSSCDEFKSMPLKANLKSLAKILESDENSCPKGLTYAYQHKFAFTAVEEYLVFGDSILHERSAPGPYDIWINELVQKSSTSVPAFVNNVFVDAYERAVYLPGEITQLCTGFIMIDIDTQESAHRQFCYDPE